MRILKYPSDSEFINASKRPAMKSDEAKLAAERILAEVKSGGLSAAMELSKKFDRNARASLAVSSEELTARAAKVAPALARAIDTARGNIEKFHRVQRDEIAVIETTPGIRCWRKEIPISSVGLYIPGGTAPLFSTALMLGVPAVLAGCKRIMLCTPPDSEGSIPPSLAYICKSLRIQEVYCIGGAQAVGLMAYGAQEIPNVQKIFGPGNQYVTCAKEIVAQSGIGIDMPAGPSEVLVIADSGADPKACAADLLAQAEHGADSQVVLLTDDENLLTRTLEEIETQLAVLPRAELARQAIGNSVGALVRNLSEAAKLSNLYAPEHLILLMAEPERVIDEITDAGSVFVGYETPESLGDYASGTNHTLPTSGYARIMGGVSLESFLKKVTFQRASISGLQRIAKTVLTMAQAEGLEGHARAVTVRLSGGEV